MSTVEMRSTRRPSVVRRALVLVALTTSMLGVQSVASGSAGAAAPTADLSVSLTHSPGSPLTGVPVTFTITATNAGPATAQAVVAGFTYNYPFRYAPPPGPSKPACRVSGEGTSAVCVLGDVPAGRSATASITLTPYTSGVFVLNAAATSDTPDPDTADRTTTDTIIVQQGPTQIESGISGVYQLVLGRTPTATELRHWVTAFNTMPYQDRYRVPLAIMSGGESRARRVDGAYTRLLHRPVGAKDLQRWTSRLAHGLTVEDFEATLVGSNEFLGRGASPTVKVTKVFQALLGRKPTSGDLATWTGRLAKGTTPGQMALGVAHGGEARARVMNAHYRASVHRVANPFEKFQWLVNLARGSSADREWAVLLTTSTYLEQFPPVYGDSGCCYAVPVSSQGSSPVTTVVSGPVP